MVATEEISRRFLLEIDITHYTLIPYYDLTGQLSLPINPNLAYTETSLLEQERVKLIYLCEGG
jgi:hypothetical protein